MVQTTCLHLLSSLSSVPFPSFLTPLGPFPSIIYLPSLSIPYALRAEPVLPLGNVVGCFRQKTMRYLMKQHYSINETYLFSGEEGCYLDVLPQESKLPCVSEPNPILSNPSHAKNQCTVSNRGTLGRFPYIAVSLPLHNEFPWTLAISLV